ncbi:MAG: serine/threonine-protein kinase [Myxococcota bacterium]
MDDSEVPPTLPMTLPGPAVEAVREITARYQFLSELDRGGMGMVLRVLDRRLQVPVALKVLHPHLAADAGWVARFRGEARLLAALRHPGVPAVHDLGTLSDGTPFYTMEEVPGRPLRLVIGDTALTRRRLLDVVMRVAATVAHAHELGIVHRDLSANNVLVSRSGDARVIDWGLARRIGDRPDPEMPEVGTSPEGSTRRWTRTGGTPGYAPPEQRAGAPADRRMDVYALGGLLGFVLQGAPPHMVADVTMDEPALAALYNRCRAQEPHDRPRDAARSRRRSRIRSTGSRLGARRGGRGRGARPRRRGRAAGGAGPGAARGGRRRKHDASRVLGDHASTPRALEDEAARVDGDAERSACRSSRSCCSPSGRSRRSTCRTSCSPGGGSIGSRWRSGRATRCSARATTRSSAPGATGATPRGPTRPRRSRSTPSPSGAEVWVERYVERNWRLIPEVDPALAGRTWR